MPDCHACLLLTDAWYVYALWLCIFAHLPSGYDPHLLFDRTPVFALCCTSFGSQH